MEELLEIQGAEESGMEKWIAVDESAKAMLARVLLNRQFTRLLSPFHRVPLRGGNVVEIVGPTATAKSQLLVQAAVNCILPKEWNGIRYGGSEGVAMLFDLDCRFDILRLAYCLQCQIREACGQYAVSYSKSTKRPNDEHNSKALVELHSHQEDELFVACMERFLCIRCYNSFELLASLKTIRPQLQKANAKYKNGVQLLMIDNIGAFYWLDRAPKSISLETSANKRPLSLQVVWETVVQELRHLLQINPMLVLATKPTIYNMTSSEYLANRDGRKWSSKPFLDANQGSQRNSFREYMPAVWQAFVTHRLLLGRSEQYSCKSGLQKLPVYTLEWETPSIRHFDRFTVEDLPFLAQQGGISLVT